MTALTYSVHACSPGDGLGAYGHRYTGPHASISAALQNAPAQIGSVVVCSDGRYASPRAIREWADGPSHGELADGFDQAAVK